MQPVAELIRRLKGYYEAAEAGGPAAPEGPLAVGLDDPLPLEDLMQV